MYEEEIHFGKLLLKQSVMVLAHLTTMTLTFEPVTPKSMGFLCYPGWMCGPSLKKVGEGFLESLIRHEKVIDGQTYQTDRHVQSNMPFFEGGITRFT